GKEHVLGITIAHTKTRDSNHFLAIGRAVIGTGCRDHVAGNRKHTVTVRRQAARAPNTALPRVHRGPRTELARIFGVDSLDPTFVVAPITAVAAKGHIKDAVDQGQRTTLNLHGRVE